VKLPYCLSLGLPLFASSVGAADLTVKINIPPLKVAEYHKPYVALWLERPDQTVAANLSVWYDLKKKDNGGAKWLKDMRQWWRKSGRELQTPIDGVTAATRAPGEHILSFSSDRAPLRDLPAGQYKLVVEAAREAGGRDLVRIPFEWPVKAATSLSANGKEELGAVSLDLKP
jgi:hypothetical protein